MSQPEDTASLEVPSTAPAKDSARSRKVRSRSPSAKSSRSSSPSTGQSEACAGTAGRTTVKEPTWELQLRVTGQLDRLAILEECAKDLSDGQLTLGELTERRIHAEELQKCFVKEHSSLELVWPYDMRHHDYLSTSVSLRFNRLAAAYKRDLARAKERLTSATAPSVSSVPSTKLPDLALPEFSGDYTQWPVFSELFESLVLNNSRLTEVEKLHYLRGCLKGQPAQLVNKLPLVAGSLKDSMALLMARYQNKRLLIQAQLDQLTALSPAQKGAESLGNLISTAMEVKKALATLGVVESLGDHLLVHLIARQFDRATRGAWKTSLGPSTDYPSFEALAEFTTSRVRTLECLEASQPAQLTASSTKRTALHTTAQPSASAARLFASGPIGHPCDMCGQAHYVVVCEAFRGLTPAARRAHVEKKRLCYNCLGRHSARACRSTQTCRSCSGKHHTMLHLAPGTPQVEAVVTALHAANIRTAHGTALSAQWSAHQSSHQSARQTAHWPAHQPALLATALAQACTQWTAREVRLLIDPGSQLTFVSEQLVCQLNAPRRSSSLNVHGIGGAKAAHTRGLVTLRLRSLTIQRDLTIDAHILRNVAPMVPSSTVSAHVWPHLSNLRLADPDYLQPRSVDIILGADYYGIIIRPNIVRGRPSAPISQLSVFGWLILGPTGPSCAPSYGSYHVTTHQDDALQELLTRFWIQEELPGENRPSQSPEEEECEAHFRSTHSREPSGRYIVRIPLKTPSSALGSSRQTASRALLRTVRRLEKNAHYGLIYRQFMEDYEQLGHMRRVVDVEPTPEMTLSHEAAASGGTRVLGWGSTQHSQAHPPYYLPHHGVLKPDSSTTKLRVVFNGSSPTSTGISVNDIMHTGANLLLNIADVLIWIRQHRHIFSTDITKMYRQISVHKDDWDLQRILWIDDQLNQVPFQLTTVTYGLRAAPFLATRTLLQLLEVEGHAFPLSKPFFTHGRYVDDLFGGADTVAQLTETAHQLKGLCNAGGFPLAKWHALHPEVLAAVSAVSTSGSSVSLDDCNTKVLGLRWVPQEDKFTFEAKFEEPPLTLTKRLILSEVAQIFDLLGFVSPVVIKAKVLLQELWLLKLGWDNALPAQICNRWLILRSDLCSLTNITVPRWMNTWTSSTVELHGFSDASQLAMGAVVYLTVNSPSTGSCTALVCAKTKVAPLRPLTIPRLELTAAVMLAKLVSHLKVTLQLKIETTHLWTDSQVVLTWITSPAARWKDYVRNRVTLVQELCNDSIWRHVPGSSNPADCASRGVTTDQLISHSLWWSGPAWLAHRNSWPAQPKDLSQDLAFNEVRPGTVLLAAVQQPQCHWDLVEKYFSLTRLLKITVLCMRFVKKLRSELSSLPVVSPMRELDQARIFWIKSTQAAYFPTELGVLARGSLLPSSHVFTRLTAFIDDQGVIRVGGRLNNLELAFEEKHPAILPRHSHLTTLVIDHSHRTTLHGGTQLTLGKIRQSCWIIGGRAPVKSHILRCVTCTRQRGIRAQQLMGQLPLPRITPSRPFAHSGVDYAGPVQLKAWKGSGSKSHKGWICVFVCLATSAVHLELVSDCSTDGFLAAYRRFSSRRGPAHTLYSDCGTNFIGADAVLKKLFQDGSMEHEQLNAALSAQGTQWRFNVPSAPHMSGKWEAAVKSVKYHLRRVLKEILLTFEEFTTLLTQIEAVLNSRPLEPLIFSPGHFLIGAALNSVPEPSLLETSPTRLKRWQLLQQRVQQFWNQWSAQYLQRQLSISKWYQPFQRDQGRLPCAHHRRKTTTYQMAARTGSGTSPGQGRTDQDRHTQDSFDYAHPPNR